MNIEIVSQKTEHFPNLGRYFFIEMRNGKHHVSMSFARGEVRVCVHNASNRTWRGLGKSFTSYPNALFNYKTAAIREMITLAGALNLQDMGV